MIFQDGHSGLVRLSDCLKAGVGNAFETARAIILFYQKYADELRGMREIGERHKNDYEIRAEALREEVFAISDKIPDAERRGVLSRQYRLHSEVLGVILTSCFTLESYINSLGYYLLRERDIIGLVRNSTSNAADAFLQAIDKMSTLNKWKTIANLKSKVGFDTAISPFQDVKILFQFRNDHVHDKVVDWDETIDPDKKNAKKLYNGKLPDTFGELLTLSQAVYACDTYWKMIIKIHELVGVPAEEFHQHYNLKPWFDEGFENQVRQTSEQYMKVVTPE